MEEESDPGIRSFVEPEREVIATVGYVASTGLYLLRAITALAVVKITIRSGKECLIADNLEKKYKPGVG